MIPLNEIEKPLNLWERYKDAIDMHSHKNVYVTCHKCGKKINQNVSMGKVYRGNKYVYCRPCHANMIYSEDSIKKKYAVSKMRGCREDREYFTDDYGSYVYMSGDRYRE